MKRLNFYSISIGFAALFMLGFLVIIFTGNIQYAGSVLIAFFAALAIGCRGFQSLKGYSYTIMIFAAVTMAMYYPFYFLEVGDYKLTSLITPLIQIIMFGMGTSMSAKDFVAIIKTPKGVFVGIASQFLIMPCLGFFLAIVTDFSSEIAAGIVLIGCSPSGLASNVMAYLAKANLALSVTITSIATLLAPFLTPLLMKLLAGEFVEINMFTMMLDISKMILVPIGAGLIFNNFFSGKAKWLDNVMPIISMAGIALIIVVTTAAGRNNLMEIGGILILVVLIHNISGYTLGYWFARLFKMPESDCRTIAIEVGMQNAGIANGLAHAMGKLGTMGLAPMIFGPMMNITGSILASYWKGKPLLREEGFGDKLPEESTVVSK